MTEFRQPESLIVYRIMHRRDAYRYGEVMKLHPKILEKNGKKEFVILPYEEFERIESELSDYEDLRDLREAKGVEQNEKTRPLADVRDELDI
ncbi:MAG: hypothetical protein ACOCU4_08740 [Alkalispirochaeta sp.]